MVGDFEEIPRYENRNTPPPLLLSSSPTLLKGSTSFVLVAKYQPRLGGDMNRFERSAHDRAYAGTISLAPCYSPTPHAIPPWI